MRALSMARVGVRMSSSSRYRGPNHEPIRNRPFRNQPLHRLAEQTCKGKEEDGVGHVEEGVGICDLPGRL